MTKRILWLGVSGLMALSLAMAACGPVATPTTPTPATPTTPTTPTAPTTPTTPVAEKPQQEAAKPAPEAPKYGGAINLVLNAEPLHFDGSHTVGQNNNGISLINTSMWLGDWAKGLAGGYGTGETDWRGQYDIWEHKTGNIAESWKWSFDEVKGEGAVVYQIRRGLHYGLDPRNPDSRLVNGREITADDIVLNLKRANYDVRSYLYGNTDLRSANITKTGPWEVTVKTTRHEALTSIITRFSGSPIYPAEVIQKYGDMRDWKHSVSSGPFMLADYVPGSAITFVRNANYWGKDPVGPGKGNQLPYLDSVKMFIIPDASTRMAAIRTGKVDQYAPISWEELAQLRKTTPALVNIPAGPPNETGLPYIFMNTTKPPFNDVRVRRAMSMAIDMEAIRKTINGGFGEIISWPHNLGKGYEGIYLGVNEPEMPPDVRELYVYNPEKAKQLLKEAGYPNGFKTTATVLSSEVDGYSIHKDYLARVGIDVTLNTVEPAVKTNIASAWQHEGLIQTGHNPIGIWYMASDFWGKTIVNGSMVDDPIINKAIAEIRITLVKEGTPKAMKLWKEMLKYLYGQAYVINVPRAPAYVVWWPWVKNYSGENTIGYYDHPNWVFWVWYDQDLKKSMGH